MKKLLLIRHAKSSWDDFSVADHERPLNQRGRRDAPMMAQRLLANNQRVQYLVTSSAIRALSTAETFATAWEVHKDNFEVNPVLYHATPLTFWAVARSIPDKYNSAAIFSHNPGITNFVNQLGVAKLDNMPTCGVFGVEFKVEAWSAIDEETAVFWFFDYPKNF